ncbi:MAG TPA: hypothetical protein VK988_00735 [Acidimicrobiales bacterium]|nr:hypothetical protein [Acidimicrobiales bacterium]
MSADARGESDGVSGVDGRTISAEARAKVDHDGDEVQVTARRAGNVRVSGSASAER